MKYYKRYFDKEKTEEVSEEIMMSRLEDYYSDIDMAINQIKSGKLWY